MSEAIFGCHKMGVSHWHLLGGRDAAGIQQLGTASPAKNRLVHNVSGAEAAMPWRVLGQLHFTAKAQ